MKAALWRVLEFFVCHDRRDTGEPVRHSYCICGALKAAPNSQQRDASLRAESRPQAVCGELLILAESTIRHTQDEM